MGYMKSVLQEMDDGMANVAECEECGESTFNIKGQSSDGVEDYGICSSCGHQVTFEEVEDNMVTRSVERDK